MSKKQEKEKELKSELQEFNAKIEELKAEASKAKESSAKLGYFDKLEALVLKRDLTKSKLEELQNSEDGA